ncbi:putative FKBP type peptidyl prolyl cis trans isomerase [Trypanosoma vivax]|uniref:peptidylprolyl isomerase n=1 Tax=Trypanosoma vivax (strain Y486) TaxID=1055687 RepID=G0U4T9_TRYVY|nr:putative FKBP-type peptidylprolyl cis-trans isomerase [Trypanosoma vivax]KAH8611368.1 putative FKBP type peptidyl prolyl cis trans isomerase [Trypanosoma vivax]CCC52454.1 putative FKBP-type peptidylprolyl cis-trans isomerase [Trypanosoma vivax Y486]
MNASATIPGVNVSVELRRRVAQQRATQRDSEASNTAPHDSHVRLFQQERNESAEDPQVKLRRSASFLPSSKEIGMLLWGCVLLFLLIVLVAQCGFKLYFSPTDMDKVESGYMKHLHQHWSLMGDQFIASVSKDPSFSRYKNTRIYFRAIKRSIPVPGVTPVQYVSKISLPEVNSNNEWLGDGIWDGSGDGSSTNLERGSSRLTRHVDSIRCVGEDGPVQFHVVAFLTSGVRFTSSYILNGEPESHVVKKHIKCMQAVLPLMCEGDKWEIVCPPEAAFGKNGERDVPPGGTTIWRISVEDVGSSKPRSRAEAEALLSSAVLTANGSPAMTRKHMFEKARKYLASSTSVSM